MNYIDIDAVMEVLTSLLTTNNQNKNNTSKIETDINNLIKESENFKKYDNYEDVKYEDSIIIPKNDANTEINRKWYRWKTTGSDQVNSICNNMKECIATIRNDFQELDRIVKEANLSISQIKEILAQIMTQLSGETTINLTEISNSLILNPYGISEGSPFKDVDLKINNLLLEGSLTEEELKKYSQEFQKFLSKHSSSQREKTVAAALFLTTMFPKLPYFWGGGHDETKEELTGLDKEWGNQKEIVFGGDTDYTIGSNWPKSLDCSGFVSWCMINGDTNINSCYSTTDFKRNRQLHSITEENIIDKIQIGDLADYAKGVEHVGVIVDVDKINNNIIVAHCSGSGKGMNLTTINTQTGLVVSDETGQTGKSRVGEKYFENIILWDYDDEPKNIYS